MSIGFRTITSLAVVAIVAVSPVVTGCGKRPNTATPAASSPSPSPSVDPVVELATAVRNLATSSFKTTVKNTGGDGPSTATAVVDPPAKNAMVTIEAEVEGGSVKMEMMVIGSDRYTRLTGAPLAEFNSPVWMHLDTSKADANPNLTVDKFIDPIGGQQFGKAIRTAQRTSPGHFTGTFDLMKALDSVSLTESEANAIGAPAQNVPFEAATDDKGRFATLTFTVPAHGTTPSSLQETTFSDYGSPVILTKPTGAEVKEAPASAYEMLGA